MSAEIEHAARTRHEDDVYAWAEQQAALLRARRFAELDLEHLIEEIEEVGGSLRRAMLNDARIVIEHLLKLEYSPARDPRRVWRATVLEHRARLETGLTPALRPVVEAELPRLYRLARTAAATARRDNGEVAAADALPRACPYTLADVTGDWLP